MRADQAPERTLREALLSALNGHLVTEDEAVRILLVWAAAERFTKEWTNA